MKPRCLTVHVFILLSVAYVESFELLVQKTIQSLSNQRAQVDQLNKGHPHDTSAGKQNFTPRGRHVTRGPRRRCRYSKRNCCGCWCPVSEASTKPTQPDEGSPCCCCPTPWSAPCTGWDCCNGWNGGFSCDCGCDCGCGGCCQTGCYPFCSTNPFPCCEYKKRGVGTDKCAHKDNWQPDEHRSNEQGAKEPRFLPCCSRRTYGHCGNFWLPGCSSFCCYCKRQKVKKKDHNKQVFIPGWIGSPPIDPSWFGLCARH